MLIHHKFSQAQGIIHQVDHIATNCALEDVFPSRNGFPFFVFINIGIEIYCVTKRKRYYVTEFTALCDNIH